MIGPIKSMNFVSFHLHLHGFTSSFRKSKDSFMHKQSNKKGFETKAIRSQISPSQYREHSVPLYMTSSFTYPDAEAMRATFAGEREANIYSRFSNPNTDELCDKITQLEGCEAAFATASGMAAIVEQILSKWGVTHTFVDPLDVESWEAAVQPTSVMLVLETPSNPGLAIVDLAKAGAFAKQHGLIFNVDNCFATPYLQNPAKFGADLVVHSATKFLDGQGRVVGGVVAGRADLIAEIRTFCRRTGPAMSPFNAWVISKSIETLAVRMDRHCANALALAQRLEGHPAISKVLYPHLPSHPQYAIAKAQMSQGGALVTFELKEGLQAGVQFLNSIKMCSLTANLGDARTIVTHPASTTHAKIREADRLAAGITDGLIRISVGLESIDDILEDVIGALENDDLHF